MNLPHEQGCVLAVSANPTYQRRAVVEQHDVHAASRPVGIHHERFPELSAAIVRKSDLDARAAVRRRKPGRRNAVAVGGEGGSVDRASVDLPTIVVKEIGIGPFVTVEPGETNVADLVL
jgi:hypothetical protein